MKWHIYINVSATYHTVVKLMLNYRNSLFKCHTGVTRIEKSGEGSNLYITTWSKHQ